MGGGCVGDALVDCHCGGFVWRGRWDDSDSDGVGAAWGAGCGCCCGGDDCAGWNERMRWDTDVVFADSLPGIATSAIGIRVAAYWRGRWWGRNDGCCGCLRGGRSRDTDVVLADCRVRITTSAVLVSVATEGNDRRGSGCG